MDAGHAQAIRNGLRRPAGAYLFTYKSSWLFDPDAGGDGIIFQVPTGAHLFRVQRNEDLTLTFLHASPTTGTRTATVDLRRVPKAPEVSIGVRWNPEETTLSVAPVVPPDQPRPEVHTSAGLASPRRIAVHESGMIEELGAGVMAARMYSGGLPIFAPSALDSWSDVREAIRVLLTGSSPDTMYPMLVANQIISILNTGFESFAKTRFIELEREGWLGDFAELSQEFLPNQVRQQERAAIVAAARQTGRTPVWLFTEKRRIDFGDYDAARRAYKAAYGLRFGIDLGLANKDLKGLQRYIQYRHRIVHLSPIMGFLNPAEMAHGEEAVVSGLSEGLRAIELFERFIDAFHRATLRIRLPD